MQINKAQNIQVQNLLGSITHKDVGAKSAAQAAPDVKIDVQYQEYINSALDCAADNDAALIEQTRKLIASGALDTPEAARNAAQNLLKFGI
jgi:hypothetical protein